MGIEMTWFIWLFMAQEPGSAQDLAQEMAKVKRVHVDRFTPSDGSEQIRDLLIAALQRSKLFVVTENAERADAFLRGGAEDVVYNDDFQFSEGLNARIGVGTGRGTGMRSRGASVQSAGGESESERTTERKHEAMATVRLVSREGDVLWAYTRESKGSKVKAASLDVVEKIVEQLRADMSKARAGGK